MYIRMDCKGVSALGVGGNGLWECSLGVLVHVSCSRVRWAELSGKPERSIEVDSVSLCEVTEIKGESTPVLEGGLWRVPEDNYYLSRGGAIHKKGECF